MERDSDPESEANIRKYYRESKDRILELYSWILGSNERGLIAESGTTQGIQGKRQMLFMATVLKVIEHLTGTQFSPDDLDGMFDTCAFFAFAAELDLKGELGWE